MDNKKIASQLLKLASQIIADKAEIELSEAKADAKKFGLTIKTTKNSFGYSATIYDTKSELSTKGNVFPNNPEVKEFLGRLSSFRELFRDKTVTYNGMKVYGLQPDKGQHILPSRNT